MTIIDSTPVGAVVNADSLDSVRGALKDEPAFRADSTVMGVVNSSGTAIDVSAQTKHGFQVSFRADVNALTADPAGVATQLQALAHEELARRYEALKIKVLALAGDVS